ncbi:hypothetical protein LEMLEM_LOCUS24165 [Lemmus lemmus]
MFPFLGQWFYYAAEDSVVLGVLHQPPSARMQARRGHQTPLQTAVSHHVVAGN